MRFAGTSAGTLNDILHEPASEGVAASMGYHVVTHNEIFIF
jgi:hypothetical protein